MRGQKSPILSAIPLRVLVAGATALTVLIPAIFGGILLDLTQRKLVLETYAQSLTDSMAAAQPLENVPERQAFDAVEQRLSYLVHNYCFTLYLVDAQGVAMQSRSYNLGGEDANSFPFSQEIYHKMQQEGVQTKLCNDLYRGQLIYASCAFPGEAAAVGVFPVSQFRASTNRFWMVIALMCAFTGLLLIVLHLILQRNITIPLQKLLFSIRNPSLPPTFAPYIGWKNEVGGLCLAYHNRIKDFDGNLERLGELNDQKRQSELEALQNQINSHFIYNTLNNIQWLASAGRTDDVIATVKALDCLLRACSHNESEMVTIEEELSYVEAYLTAQRIRFGDVFDYTFEVEVLLM